MVITAAALAVMGLRYRTALTRAVWCPGPESNRHAFRRGILSPLCLPVSPPGRAATVFAAIGPKRSGGGGRNRTGVHGFAGRCMTTLPPRQSLMRKGKARVAAARAFPSVIWSGKRVSNSRPQPWQGCALPTELFPRFCEGPHYKPLVYPCSTRAYSRAEAYGRALRR
jgi:hypothetical protein